MKQEILKRGAIGVAGILLAIGIFIGWKIVSTGEEIHIENPSAKNTFENITSILPGNERETLSGEENKRVNILLLGRAGEKYPGKHLTDTVILVSIDTEGHRAGFLSLPRDLYTPIPGTDLYTKLNSLYQYGLSEGSQGEIVRQAVEDITGVDIPYFISLDFDGFERVIDDLGGIKIYSERDIFDTRYPGKNYSYETFELSKGWHELDGKTALKYARERHSDPEGDFGRAKRQQEIIKAAQEKAFSTQTYLNAFTLSRLLDTLGDSVRTNLSIAEIASLGELAKTTDLRNASTAIIDAWKKESLLRVSHIQVGEARAFILVPRTGNWNEIREVARNIFDQTDLQKRKAAIAEEAPTIRIITTSKHFADAKKFSRAIQSSLDIETPLSVEILPTLEKSDKNAIIDHTDTKKPYALDTLIKSFDLEKLPRESMPEAPRSRKNQEADFTIVFRDNATETPLSEMTQGEKDDTIVKPEEEFSDFLAPQKKK